jgi:hypothetical protein
MLVPLIGFVQGDSLGLVVLAQQRDRIADVAASLQQAASVRVAPRARVALHRGGARLDPERTVAEVGLRALERIDLVVEDG